ncbi:MAG TPA: hypothetical protein VFX50_11995 [Gemmatimonadales bacterium]|nr:hypothetical protein [Gemmatimonadales bacterium]
MSRSLSLRFASDRFDRDSELPTHYNAGNRFYGRDLAEYLAGALSARGLPAEMLDEDWGWLVFATRESGEDFEVAVYLLSDEDDPAPPGADWGLWVRAHERRRLLGLVPRRVEIPVPPHVEAAVRDAVHALGATPRPWDDGPD